MKNILLVGAGILLVVVGIAYMMRPAGNSILTKEAPQESYDPIVLFVEKGEVAYKTPSQNDYVIATATVEIPNRTMVQTKVGRASVLLPDNTSISLRENTEITINYSPTKTSIFQSFGSTYHRVETLLTGSSYQVQTPETLASVRGTKFGVIYDKNKRKTKVAVTEHTVEVETNKNEQATSSVKESKMVKEGEMASIEGEKLEKKEINAFVVFKSESDTEVKKVIEEEKKRDVIFDQLKESSPTRELFRQELQKTFFETNTQTGSETESKTGTIQPSGTRTEIKTETQIAPREIVPVQEQPQTEEITRVITPLDEETFYTKFEGMFIANFFVDDACQITATPDERVRRVTTFAKESGYPFDQPSLLSFAQSIVSYCKTKDPATKEILLRRFDDEYPY